MIRGSKQWHVLGAAVFLLTLTTSLRVTLYLSTHADYQQEQQADQLPPPIDNQPDDQFVIGHEDTIFKRIEKEWDTAPVVIEEYKLIFFTIPKVACTTWKMLFRRMKGVEDWNSQDPKRMLPHNPIYNNLTYLWDYSIEEASRLMTSPEYTRAIFVREPKQRFLSAFLDKAFSNYEGFIYTKCCAETRDCLQDAQTAKGFLNLIHHCTDAHWMPQHRRMESKFWKHINFVGHLENIKQDGTELLQRVGAWDKYGATGWGKYGNATMFGSAKEQTHSTWAGSRVWQWYTPALERQVEAYYAADYANPLFQFQITNLTKDFWILGSDKVYSRTDWDGAPIVVEKYKLIFFTIPRVAATSWKKAFRRMEGQEDWKADWGPRRLPHDPTTNGLKYLFHYEPLEAEKLLKNPEWTKAIFLRNPKDRFLSAYSKLLESPQQVRDHCCPLAPGCENQLKTMTLFIDLMQTCQHPAWDPLTERIEDKYWEYIDFIGYLDNIEEDSERLLKKIGAWEDIGASGWGPRGTDRIFTKEGSEMNRMQGAMAFYTANVDRLVEEVYKADYNNKLFKFSRKPTVLQMSQGGA